MPTAEKLLDLAKRGTDCEHPWHQRTVGILMDQVIDGVMQHDVLSDYCRACGRVFFHPRGG
jgi:uncharacterized OB-fold protein